MVIVVTNTIHTVLFATDLAENAPAALSYAGGIASLYGARLFLVHVLDPAAAKNGMDSSSSDLRHLAEGAKNELTCISQSVLAAQGLPGEVLVRYGNVRDTVFQLQQEHSVDLVVLSSSGRKNGRGRGVGSIAEAILREMSCSVLIVGPKVKPRAVSTKTQLVLFPTDFSKRSLGALSTAVSLTTKLSATLLLLHICNPYGPDSCFGHEATCKKNLSEIAHSVEKQKIPVEQLVREGKVEANILSVAKEKRADFIIMGVHHGDLDDGTRLHGTVSEIVREASCPVFTIVHEAKTRLQ
jgi:nucleotide-binding universal stress UspA family protein